MYKFTTIGIVYSNKKFNHLEELAEKYSSHLFYFDDIVKLLDYIFSVKPNYLFLDLDFCNSFELLKVFKKIMNNKNEIKIISSTNINSFDEFYLSEENYENFFLHITETILSNKIVNYIDKNKISQKLIELGFSSKQLGFLYLKDIIELCLECGCINYNLNKGIYPQIARKYNKTCKSIDKCVTRVIDNAYTFSKREEWFNILKANSLLRRRPSNKEFLGLFCENFIEIESFI